MKTKPSKLCWIALLMACSTVLMTALHAQDSSRDHGAPIIFSAPKSDNISSNLHNINQKESPFKGMESNIRKPFEIFDTEKTQPKFSPARNLPAPARDNSNMKSILEQKAEERFLNGENSATDDPNDPFKSPDSLLDPYNKGKPKTSLDRYYDRIEKDQAARTNANTSTDLFGKKKDDKPDDYLGLNDKKRDDPFNREQDSYTRSNRRMSNNASIDKDNSPLNGFTKATKMFESRPTNPQDREFQQRESRLDNFKKLLDGNPSSAPAQNPYLNNGNPTASAYSSPYNSSVPTSTRPTYLSPTPPAYQPKPYGNSQPNGISSFSTTAGVVGAPGRPTGIQDFGVSSGASISTPIAPIQQPRRVISTYNPPTRR